MILVSFTDEAAEDVMAALMIADHLLSQDPFGDWTWTRQELSATHAEFRRAVSEQRKLNRRLAEPEILGPPS